MGCFRFSDSGHEFEKLTEIENLTEIDIIFLHLFFLFHPSMLFILKNGLRDFLKFLFNQVIMIS